MIAFTMTIPDPRPRAGGGRWDLPPSRPPEHPRRDPVDPTDQAALEQTWSPAIRRDLAILAQYAVPALAPDAPPAASVAVLDPAILDDAIGVRDDRSSAGSGHSHSKAAAQYAQIEPTDEDPMRELGTDGREQSDIEVLRGAIYNETRAKLTEVDPRNAILRRQYMTGPGGFVPTEAQLEELQSALANARASGPTREGPANTFADPGAPAIQPKAGTVKVLPDNPSLGATASEAIRKHILDGDDAGGGHRPSRNLPGKSEFPPGWSDDRIIEDIESVANDSASSRQPGRRGRIVVEGTRGGVDIKVIIDDDGKTIVTGFPTNTTRNPKGTK